MPDRLDLAHISHEKMAGMLGDGKRLKALKTQIESAPKRYVEATELEIQRECVVQLQALLDLVAERDRLVHGVPVYMAINDLIREGSRSPGWHMKQVRVSEDDVGTSREWFDPRKEGQDLLGSLDQVAARLFWLSSPWKSVEDFKEFFSGSKQAHPGRE